MKKDKKDKIILCKICGSKMEEYKYAYDNNENGKVYFKCSECGNKINIVKLDKAE